MTWRTVLCEIVHFLGFDLKLKEPHGMDSADHSGNNHGRLIRISSEVKIRRRWMYRLIWILLSTELATGVLQLFLGAMVFNCTNVPQAIIIGEILALVAVSYPSYS
jgi:hypothetical protein